VFQKCIVNLAVEARFFQPSFLTLGKEMTLRLFKENSLRIFWFKKKSVNEFGNYSNVSNVWGHIWFACKYVVIVVDYFR